MTIDSLLKLAYGRLALQSDTAQLDAQLLLAHVLGVSTSYFFTWPEKVVSDSTNEQFNALLTRREQGEPIAYILGQQDFWTLSLETSKHTLIPRADTERLVEVALELQPNGVKRVLDLGTGTGAIALALAYEWPSADVVGIDFQAKAVALAQQNAVKNDIKNARFLKSNWFSALADEPLFDVIVSNPPYIDPDDQHLTQGDVRFEPITALVADDHGLADIKQIIDGALQHLIIGGWLMFEHGFDQAKAVQQLFSDKAFKDIATYQDLGGNDRVTVGRLT
ncbi:peptide chain release factor N(5)-glutamine methyltransferase [Marinomonas atlantica]|uniref:peptide chain release factor N(5)-glutamine methyltransferase n=1 Tax=Marinomonas atlantica TaxID=1806668 RepID=UPI000829A21D|nr:peptide chain release factor N(5)-glutamine methyltransferase [Marinomonas atlantica]